MNLIVNPSLKEKLGKEDLEKIEMMKKILETVSGKPLVFKGGTALMFYYRLDRFSEDLDFDSPYPVSVNSLCNILREIGEVTVKKDTDTVKRLMLKPFNKDFSIKLEVSLRDYKPVDKTVKIGERLTVYGVNDLFLQKVRALVNRRKARDLYDLTFLLEEWGDYLSIEVKEKLLSIFQNKLEIYDLIPQFIDEFRSNRLLTDSDLLKSVERLMSFYEKNNSSSF
ncbi:nucleotidyl transferase AbiEii/AbiGii toxin family protein [Desulfurobacterium sp.]